MPKTTTTSLMNEKLEVELQRSEVAGMPHRGICARSCPYPIRRTQGIS